jgi:hypothetical protein
LSPNITGQTGEVFLGSLQFGNQGAIFNTYGDGVPMTGTLANTHWGSPWVASDGNADFGCIKMDASKSSAIYGSNSKVQIPAINVLVAIRY